MAGNYKNDIIKASESGEKNTLMFLQFKRKKRFSLGAFVICASFLFVLGISFDASATTTPQSLSTYQKPESGTLFYTDWNNLIVDFVKTWGDSTISGNLIFPNTTNASKNGIIYKNSVPFIHDFNYGYNGATTTAGQNIFVGAGAGNLTMGASATNPGNASLNTAVGYEALHLNTLGGGNSALGRFSLYSNTSGSGNSAVGVNSLYSNTYGANNSAVGSSALFSNTSGSYNSALGYNAGRYIYNGTSGNTTGSYSVFLGQDSRALGDNQSNQIVIGYNAIGAGSNSVVLGNTSITKTVLRGNVGISTSSPQAALDVYDGNIFIRDAVITSLTPKAAITKEYLDSSLSSTTASIITQVATSSFWQGAMDDDIWNNNVGNVGIGTSEPAALFNVNGEALIGGNTLRYGTQYKLQVTGTDKGIYIGMPSLPADANSGNAFGVGVISEGYTRGLFYSNGTYGIGPGNNVRDTFIGRSSANTLRIGSSYDLSGAANLLVNGKIGIGTLSPSGLVDLYNSAGSNLRVTGSVNSENAGSIDLLEGTSLFSASGSYGVRLVYEGVANRFYIQTANNTTTSTRLTIARDTGNVGINTGEIDPLDKLHVVGQARVSGIAGCSGADAVLRTDASGRLVCGTALSGTGTTNYVARWTGTSTLGKGVLYDNGTNVGIGTTDPGDKLTVSGNIQTMVPLSNNGYYAKDNAGSHIFSFTRQNNNLSISANASIGLAVGKSTPSSSYAMFLQSGTNNVGIGTTNPEAKLDIAGSLRASGAVSFTNPLFVGGGSRLMMVDNAGNLSATTTAAVLPPGTMTLPAGANGQTLRYNSGAWVANSTIYNNGANVGIGTTSPSQKLHVYGGDALITGVADTARMRLSTIGGSVARDWMFFSSSSDGSFGIYDVTGGARRMTINTDGSIGLGTNSTQFNINAAGNVGIGTTSPTQKLTVAGNVGFDTGKFTTDGSGNATFESFRDQSNALYKLDPSDAGTSLNIAGSVNSLGTTNSNYFAGNVGVGITDPGAKLAVVGNSGIIGRFVQNATWTGSEYALSVYGYTNLNNFRINGADGARSLYLTTSGGQLGFASNNGIITFTNGSLGTTERMRIDAVGNVGIGTTTPLAKLHISVGQNKDVYIGNGGAIGAPDLSVLGASVLFTRTTNQYADSGIAGYTSVAGGSNLAIKARSDVVFVSGNSNDERMRIKELGNVGIGTTAPTAKLDVNGTFRVSGSLNSVVLDKLSGSGSRIVMTDSSGSLYATSTTVATGLPDPSTAGNGATLRSNGSSWVANTNIFNNGTNVGIGTASPFAKLVVKSATSTPTFVLSKNGLLNGDSADLLFHVTTAEYIGTDSHVVAKIQGIRQGAGATGDLAFLTETSDSSVTEKMRILANGNVGIGTTSPTQKLTVAGNVGFDTGKFTTDGSGNATFESFRDQSNALYKLDPSDAGTSLNIAGSVNSLGTTNSNYFAGNVGIGTASPENSEGWMRVLNVYGSSNSKIITSTNLVQTGMWAHNSSYYSAPAGGLSGTKTNHPYSLITNGISRLTVSANGNVGIGTSAPGSNLDVNGTDQSAAIRVSMSGIPTVYSALTSNSLTMNRNTGSTVNLNIKTTLNSGTWGAGGGDILFSPNNSELVRLTAGGLVGIGTTNPTAKLDVNGTFRVSGSLNSVVLDKLSGSGSRIVMTDSSGSLYATSTTVATGLPDPSTAGNGTTLRSNGSSWIANSTIYNNGTNVGIGTVSLASKLNVYENTTKVGSGAGLTIEQAGTGDAILHLLLTGVRRYQIGIDNSDGDKLKLGVGDDWSTRTDLTINTSGNVGIGTTTPTQKLTVAGNVGFDTGKFTTDGSGNATFESFRDQSNALYKLDPSDTNTSLYTAGTVSALGTVTDNYFAGNVGIGVADPSSKLFVVGHGRFGSSASAYLDVYGNGTSANVGQNVNSAIPVSVYGAGDVQINLDSNNNETNRVFSVRTNALQNGTELFRVQENGNVGIGTNQPVTLLHVNGNGATVDAMALITAFTSTRSRFAYWDPAAPNTKVAFGSGWGVATDFAVHTKTSGDFSELTQRLTVKNNGNVGIGTTSPVSLLDVNGLIKMRTALISQPEDVINKGYLESALGGGEGFSSLAGFWKLNGSDLYASSTSWNVGIGTTDPHDPLHVAGILRVGPYYSDSDRDQIELVPHGADTRIRSLNERFHIENTGGPLILQGSSGSVGIGTTAPTKKLDVNGDLLVRNAATFSSSITASLLNGAAGRLVSVGADGTFGAISAASSGQTLRFTGSAWVPNSVIYNNGTNVGIGTASPSGKLGVLQNMSNYNSSFTSPHLKLQAGNIVDNTGFVGIAYEASTAPNYGWSSGSFRGSTSAALASFIWKYHNNDAAGVEYMRISHSGNVGIGTTAPTKKLDVNGDLLVRNAATFSSSITASLLSGTAGRLVAVDASGTLYATSSSVATGLPEPTSAGDGATLRSNGTSWVANTNIFNNGTSVGIGTSNPGSLLTIANNNWISGRNSTDTGVVNMFKLNASNQIEVGAPLLIGPLEFAADSGLISFTDMPVTAASLVGTPQGYVMKIDGNNLLTVYSESNGSGGIQNSRVGIGTASPTQTLTVAGNVGFDSSKFTTDGAGTATFESFRDVSNSLYKLDPSDTNTSLYVAGTVSALGTATNNYFAGNVGIGITNPGAYKLYVNGNTNVNGLVTWSGGNSSHLGTGANVTTYVGNSSVNNAIIRSNNNSNDAWIMNWGDSPTYGIYNRNIESDLAVAGALTVPSNSTAFIGAGLAKAYIQHSTGNAGFAGTLSVGGNATFSQPVIVGAPTNPAHAATKNYVDSIVATTSDLSIGFWTKASGKLYPTDTSLNVGIGTTNPLAKLHLNGGLIMKTSFVANTNYTAQAADYIIAYSSITADRTVTLPNSLCTPGRFFIVMDQSGSANSGAKIIIDPEGTTPIVGGSTFMISNPYNAVYVFCGNNAWFLL